MRFLRICFVCIIIMVCTISIVGFPTSSAASQGKAYTIWSSTSIGDSVVYLQKIPDVNNDMHEDVLVVSRVATGTAGGGYLRILDGRSGAVIRTSNTLGFEPSEACYVGGYIAVATSGGIGVYDLQFKHQYSIAASSSTTIPDHLQTLSDSAYLMFIDGISAKSYDVQNRRIRWTYSSSSASKTNRDLLILSSIRTVFAYPVHNKSYDGWRMDLIDDHGSRIGGATVRGLMGSVSSDSLRLGTVDSSQFTLTKMNSTVEALVSYSITGNSFLKRWERQIDRSISNKAFSIGDINSDGNKEAIATWRGNLTVYNGVDGSILYITNMDSSPGIRYVVLGDDVDSDGVPEVTVNTGNSLHLVKFRYSSYVDMWDQYVDNCNGLIAIQDVDGDGHRDFITASGTNIKCLWGSYDNQAPLVSLSEPFSNANISRTLVVFRVRANDTQSGIASVSIIVDNQSYSAVYNSTTGYFEAIINLATGAHSRLSTHSWYARVYDRVSSNSTTGIRYLKTDTTAPNISITSPTTNQNSSTVTARWYANDNVSGIKSCEIRLDNQSWIDVISQTNYVFSSVGDGRHSIALRATDWAFNQRESYVNFTVNATPSSPTIQYPMNGLIISKNNIAIAWSGNDTGTDIVYEISIDKGSWRSVGTAFTYNLTQLTEGNHTIEVRAVKGAGHSIISNDNFVVDTQPPSFSYVNLSINSTAPTKDLIANWSCSDNTSGIRQYEVRMDQGSWANLSLTTHYIFTSLSQGDHEFSIRAIDNAGNIEFNQFTVFVDTTPPTVFITNPTSDAETSSVVVAAWSGLAGASEIDHYEIRVDGGSWQNVGTATNCTLHSLSDGVHMVEVEAVDKAGINSSIQSAKFTVNTSLIGGLGLVDDIAIFATVIGILSLSGIIVRSRRRSVSVKSAPESNRKYCKSCGILIFCDAVYCPQCGTLQEAQKLGSVGVRRALNSP